MSEQRYFLAGGAGFIGSATAAALLRRPETERVTVFDNFSSGRAWHVEALRADHRFQLVRGDLHDAPQLLASMRGHDCVFHFASNPDIARAVTDPDIDFREGTELTRNVAEAMRLTGARLVLYTSGSGVYGDLGETVTDERFGPLVPVSTYAASKIAGEALLCSYAHMFGIRARAFRFANVVGSHQTHGVGYDFILRLLGDPTRLRILGDGTQSKSYIHVDDVVAAMLLAKDEADGLYQVFNVGTGDYITVNQIAEEAISIAGLDPGQVTIERTGGRGGWKGDVPVMRLDSRKIEALGWRCARGARQAIRESLRGILENARRGRFT